MIISEGEIEFDFQTLIEEFCRFAREPAVCYDMLYAFLLHAKTRTNEEKEKIQISKLKEKMLSITPNDVITITECDKKIILKLLKLVE